MRLQTDEDLRNQDRIATRFAKALNCEWGRLIGEYSLIDVYFYNTPKLDFIGTAEIKCRNTHSLDGVPCVIIDADKYQALYLNTVSFGRPAYFIAEYKEGIVYANIARICKSIGDFEMKVIGRKDRNYSNDIRPAILIPKVYFSMI